MCVLSERLIRISSDCSFISRVLLFSTKTRLFSIIMSTIKTEQIHERFDGVSWLPIKKLYFWFAFKTPVIHSVIAAEEICDQ